MTEVQQLVSTKKERSTAYPGITLEESISAVEQLSTNLGSGPYSREAAAQALGYKGLSGASASKVAALIHFGLLEKTGNTYSQAQLARRILFPVSDEDKRAAIVEAALSPRLYKNLVEKYDGKSLPAQLNNILIHDFGIIAASSAGAAATFRSSLKFAGLLANGVVTRQAKALPSLPLQDEGQVPGLRPEIRVATSGTKFPVHLPSGITLMLPQDFAYHLGLGTFADAVKALEAVAAELRSPKPEEEQNSSTT
ncbi:MAG: hypothetical protein Q8P35_01550 [Candidatus Yanofskybacteria bacterium]|nr:hypothetical protein [Candidatus Yanofskybacteria bacterium]